MAMWFCYTAWRAQAKASQTSHDHDESGDRDPAVGQASASYEEAASVAA